MFIKSNQKDPFYVIIIENKHQVPASSIDVTVCQWMKSEVFVLQGMYLANPSSFDDKIPGARNCVRAMGNL